VQLNALKYIIIYLFNHTNKKKENLILYKKKKWVSNLKGKNDAKKNYHQQQQQITRQEPNGNLYNETNISIKH